MVPRQGLTSVPADQSHSYQPLLQSVAEIDVEMMSSESFLVLSGNGKATNPAVMSPMIVPTRHGTSPSSTR